MQLPNNIEIFSNTIETNPSFFNAASIKENAGKGVKQIKQVASDSASKIKEQFEKASTAVVKEVNNFRTDENATSNFFNTIKIDLKKIDPLLGQAGDFLGIKRYDDEGQLVTNPDTSNLRAALGRPVDLDILKRFGIEPVQINEGDQSLEKVGKTALNGLIKLDGLFAKSDSVASVAGELAFEATRVAGLFVTLPALVLGERAGKAADIVVHTVAHAVGFAVRGVLLGVSQILRAATHSAIAAPVAAMVIAAAAVAYVVLTVLGPVISSIALYKAHNAEQRAKNLEEKLAQLQSGAVAEDDKEYVLLPADTEGPASPSPYQAKVAEIQKGRIETVRNYNSGVEQAKAKAQAEAQTWTNYFSLGILN